jgi:hypothetical protein
VNPYERSIIKSTWCFCVLISLAILAPILVVTFPFHPESWVVPNAFSRSGAFVIAFSLVAEFYAIEIFNILKPAGGGYVGTDRGSALNKYRSWPSSMSKVVLIIAAMGTLISSYGDLLF